MPIDTSEIKYYGSTDNLGGPITENEITNDLHALFDIVGGLGSLQGETNYRCIYVKNENTLLTLLNTVIYIITNTASESSDLAVGVGTSTIGGIEQTIPSEVIPPIGITFVNQIGDENSVFLGSIPKGSHRSIWFRRTIDPNSSAYNNDNAVVRVRGESAA